jgi:hypothetical protein
MSGLLQRLAREAFAQQLPAIHPLARPRYAPPAAPPVPAEWPGPGTAEQSLVERRNLTPVARPRSTQMTGQPRQTVDALPEGDIAAETVPRRAEPAIAVNPPDGGDVRTADGDVSPDPPHVTRHAGAVQAQGAIPDFPRVPPAGLGDLPPPRPMDPNPLQSVSPLLPEAPAHARVGRTPDSAPAGPLPRAGVPEPLLASAPPPTRPRTNRPSPTAPLVAPEPSEVHVHIGRIEVTALQEAPVAKKAAKPLRPPMSLEQYLAKRDRGRG